LPRTRPVAPAPCLLTHWTWAEIAPNTSAACALHAHAMSAATTGGLDDRGPSATDEGGRAGYYRLAVGLWWVIEVCAVPLCVVLGLGRHEWRDRLRQLREIARRELDKDVAGARARCTGSSAR
jgi:hypothetical protein